MITALDFDGTAALIFSILVVASFESIRLALLELVVVIVIFVVIIRIRF